MRFIVKFFPEITIKSRPVRKRMASRLAANLRITLKRIDAGVTVQTQWDRILIVYPDVEYTNDKLTAICNVLETTPGISYSVLVKSYEWVNFDTLLQHTVHAYQEHLVDKRFAVRVKRTGQHDFTSHDLEVYIGAGLLKHTQAQKVDLRQPQVTVNIEIKDKQVFLVDQRIAGLGGYPLGTQESVVALISGGFDSIAAAYLTMRRGSKTHFVFFNLGGIAHELGVQQSAYYLWRKYASAARVKFFSVPFEGVAAEILQQVHHSYRGVVLKRMMMRAAHQIARRIKAGGLVTGESIAQVSSQTLTNLSVIDKAKEALIIRPLITSDKQQIIDLCKSIGAYDFAAHMPEYCGVISDRPTVKARLDKVLAEEENFSIEILHTAIQQTQMYSIDQCAKQGKQPVIHASKQLSASDVIVDVRHPDEIINKPLNLPEAKIVDIPFFKVNQAIASMPKDKQYLLYCDKGLMSRIHAMQLNSEGFTNVGVFRKD